MIKVSFCLFVFLYISFRLILFLCYCYCFSCCFFFVYFHIDNFKIFKLSHRIRRAHLFLTLIKKQQQTNKWVDLCFWWTFTYKIHGIVQWAEKFTDKTLINWHNVNKFVYLKCALYISAHCFIGDGNDDDDDDYYFTRFCYETEKIIVE